METISLHDDSQKLHAPRWLRTTISLLAELVLITVTIGIILAMWLPAYLTMRSQTAPMP